MRKINKEMLSKRNGNTFIQLMAAKANGNMFK